MKQYASRKHINLFSLDFQIFKNQQPATPASLSTLLEDIFPFFKMKSLTTLLLFINSLVYCIKILISHSWFVLNQDQPWISKVFHIVISPISFNEGIIYFVVFQSFLVLICSHIQKKLGKQDFFIFYYMTNICGYLLMQISQPKYPLCTNSSIFALYGLSLMVQEQFNEQVGTHKKIHKIYKFILFSFAVYISLYNTRYTHPIIYLGGCLAIPLVLFLKKQMRKQYFR